METVRHDNNTHIAHNTIVLSALKLKMNSSLLLQRIVSLFLFRRMSNEKEKKEI